jgi:hypothetical protein
MYTTYFDTRKPRYVKYDASEEKTKSNKEKFYRLNYRYFDFNSEIIREVSTLIDILKFRGYILINRLNAFLLSYYSTLSRIRVELINYSRRFLSLYRMYYRHYYSNIFLINKDKLVKVLVNSRVIINASFFREMNPNYVRLKMDDSSLIISYIDFFNGLSTSTKSIEKVRYANLEINELELANLLFYYLIMLDFSFIDKL